MGHVRLQQLTYMLTTHIIIVIFFNEFLVYYFSIWKCQWPSLYGNQEADDRFTLRYMCKTILSLDFVHAVNNLV